MDSSAAPTRSSFAFLAPYGPLYLRLATVAEHALALDPSLTLVSLRQLAEAFAKHAAAKAGLLATGAASQLDLLRVLEQRNIVRDRIAECFHMLRRAGNAAVHDFVGSRQEALDALTIAYRLACWFHQTFGDRHARAARQPPPYQPPVDPTAHLRDLQDEVARARADAEARRADAERTRALLEAEAARRAEEEALAARAAAERAEWEELARAYQQELDALRAAQARVVDAVAAEAATAPAEHEQEVVTAAAAATAATELTERETRVLIDAQLRDAGWEADSATLRWTAGARPEQGTHRAIAEVPTRALGDGDGSADYVLFVGLTPVAVIEAKKQARRVPSALEQAKRYARGLPAAVAADATRASDGAIGWPITLADADARARKALRYQVPFLYATNGRPYLRQLESESGVWFLDVRHPTNHPRALSGWHTPEVLTQLLAHDAAAAQARLAAEPPDTLAEALKLRPYQVRAIAAVEQALARGQRSLLVAMATGTGKTRTTIALIHRLLKTQRFHRVLFLVDRAALGQQAADAFAEVRLEDLSTFAQSYTVLGLDGSTPDAATRVHVATVQGMVKRILWSSPDEPPVPIDRYDCVIVDESHRGYTLDRELTEGELELRGFDDYVSTYRRVLDHFDAVKIGLTATPALHTREIFGDPVFVYRYREAVVDGYLVDHEPPLRILTQLARDGIRFEAGAEVPVLHPGGDVQLALLPDELDFDVASFNRTVITEGFNRAVAGKLAEHLDPQGDEKTIVFCVDDAHADRFVQLLKEAYTAAGVPVDDDAIKKLTGATDRPLDAIRRFKNEALPTVAVTVDLLTTGVDIPRVCNLVFLRRIRSRILYEQMIGRATRLCPEIRKEVFRIYDAVDLYAALSPLSDMVPVVKNVTTTTAQLVEQLVDPRAATLPGGDAGTTHADEVLKQLVARLRRVIRGLDTRAPTEELRGTIESLEAAFGCPLDGVPAALQRAGADGAACLLRDTPAVATLLERLSVAPGPGRGKVIGPDTDTIVEVGHGYGDGRTRPEDYLASFTAFLEQHRNQLAALTVVCTRPRDLTRAQLRELKLQLDAAGYSEASIRTAWRDWTNQDIAAGIIGFIRQRALGSPLVPYATRVDRALEKLLARGGWTVPQQRWLARIGEQLKHEVIVDEEAFAKGAFVNAGGWKGVDTILGGRLEQVLHDLGDEIWSDGKAA